VRFVDATYEAAAQFVATEFGAQPFLAVHWRRTDFLLVRQAQPGVLQSAPQVGLNKIFVYVEVVVYQSSILSFPPPTCITHPGAIRLHDYWTV